jgi:hypothetical protein
MTEEFYMYACIYIKNVMRGADAKKERKKTNHSSTYKKSTKYTSQGKSLFVSVFFFYIEDVGASTVNGQYSIRLIILVLKKKRNRQALRRRRHHRGQKKSQLWTSSDFSHQVPTFDYVCGCPKYPKGKVKVLGVSAFFENQLIRVTSPRCALAVVPR